jgi:hypothetical protein
MGLRRNSGAMEIDAAEAAVEETNEVLARVQRKARDQSRAKDKEKLKVARERYVAQRNGDRRSSGDDSAFGFLMVAVVVVVGALCTAMVAAHPGN